MVCANTNVTLYFLVFRCLSFAEFNILEGQKLPLDNLRSELMTFYARQFPSFFNRERNVFYNSACVGSCSYHIDLQLRHYCA